VLRVRWKHSIFNGLTAVDTQFVADQDSHF
jgi:hypothetical protein